MRNGAENNEKPNFWENLCQIDPIPWLPCNLHRGTYPPNLKAKGHCLTEKGPLNMQTTLKKWTQAKVNITQNYYFLLHKAMCFFTITHNIYVTVTWNYVNWIWLNLLESYWYEKHTKIKLNQKTQEISKYYSNYTCWHNWITWLCWLY